MNSLAGWFLMIGLFALGASIDSAATKLTQHQCLAEKNKGISK